MPDFSQLEEFLGRYFPAQVTEQQLRQFRGAFDTFADWNSRVNMISRKDLENLAERHFLHSLAIAKAIQFLPGTRIMDVGTGGGFPGIPLAIFFPDVRFHLVDSIAKKIRVVQEIAHLNDLGNVHFSVQRAENLRERTDFVISRAVASLDKFIPWVKDKLDCPGQNSLPNGILYLRGDDAESEIKSLKYKHFNHSVYPLSDWFSEPFFSTKRLVHISFCK